MKRIVAMAAALLTASLPALAAGPLGPSGPEIPAGKEEALGAGVFSYHTTWKPRTGDFGDIEINQIQPYLYAASTALSLSDRGAVFLRLGAADINDGKDFEDGFKPYVAFGMKDVWYENDTHPYKIGTILAGSLYWGYDAEKVLLPGSVAQAHIRSHWDVSLAVVAQYAPGPKVVVFGGPLFVYGRADVTRYADGVTDTATFDEANRAGLSGGIRLTLGRDWVVEGEGQARGGFSYGLSITRILE